MRADITAIIPARGGSKRIPRKNLERLNGKSLLQICIENAKRVCQIVFVSTEDLEIASEAQRWGAEVIPRPQDLAGDKIKTMDVVHHAMAFVQTPWIALFNCTVPSPGIDEIIKIVGPLIEAGAPAFTASRFHGFIYRPTGPGVHPVNRHWTHRPFTQEKVEYLENGGFYLMPREMMTHHDMIRFDSQVIEVPQSIEIDTQEDLQRCRILSQK